MSEPDHRALDVDVIVVAHNAGSYLLPAVRSAASEAGEDRVVVVDAESTDGAVTGVAAEMPGVRVIAAPNRGFAFANNVGIRATSGEFVLLLNPDAELAPGTVAALVHRAGTDDRIGVVAPRVTGPDGLIQSGSYGRFPTFARTFAEKVRRLFGRDRPPEVTEPVDVDWVTGACMLVRRAAIDDAGMMDEEYFLYYEDIEWCHRMRDRAWRVVLDPAGTVVHHLGKAGIASGIASRAYRESFYRYTRRYHLWGLAAAARVGLAARRLSGGRG